MCISAIVGTAANWQERLATKFEYLVSNFQIAVGKVVPMNKECCSSCSDPTFSDGRSYIINCLFFLFRQFWPFDTIIVERGCAWYLEKARPA